MTADDELADAVTAVVWAPVLPFFVWVARLLARWLL